MNDITKKAILGMIGFVGAGLFGFFFALTYAVPTWVEDFAADFIEAKAAERVDGAIDRAQLPAESENALVRFAASVVANNGERVDQLKQALKDKAHETMAAAIAEMQDLDCDCRARIAERMKTGFEFDLGLLRAANDKLTEFIQVKYAQTTQELKLDIRIFTATNAIAFVILLLLSLFRPRAMSHLFLPGVMLAVSVFVCSWFYVMGQDWLLTIIYGNYVGLAYAGYLVVAYAFLCDIAFNSGSVTTAILNAVAAVEGLRPPLSHPV